MDRLIIVYRLQVRRGEKPRQPSTTDGMRRDWVGGQHAASTSGNIGRVMRLSAKIAVIVGAGQSPGAGMGNGRATALRFAAEGARLLAVDRDIASAEETAAMVRAEGGDCTPFEADV